MRFFTKLLLRLVGKKVRLTTLTKEQEMNILKEMGKIEGIRQYWELQEQMSYRLYAKTKEERYLGIAELAQSLLNLLNAPEDKPEERESNGGYESTI